jgi:hypothetical protein
MKTRLLLILTALQFCSLIYAQEEIDPMRFFPSQVGNVWEYYEYGTQRYSKMILTRDSLLEDKSHLLFYNNDSIPQYKIDSSYYVYWEIYNISYKYYKLDADTGDTWIVEPNESSPIRARVTNKYYGYINWLNKETFLMEITYFYKTPASDDTTNTDSTIVDLGVETLALDIGLVSVYDIEQGLDRTLTGCIINEDTLGTIIRIKNNYQTQNVTYQLSQNYPNPFNPTTKIDYYLPIDSHIKLAIYNILGQEIKILEEGYRNLGYHTIEFDGKDLSSGIYIYRLTANKITLIRKMLFLK